jgi:hypothetical protein
MERSRLPVERFAGGGEVKWSDAACKRRSQADCGGGSLRTNRGGPDFRRYAERGRNA